MRRPSSPAAGPETLNTLIGLSDETRCDVSTTLTLLLADVFALLVKTKGFQWRLSGPQFRDRYLMLDEQAGQLLSAINPLAERVRKIGGRTLGSIGDITRLQRIRDNDLEGMSPHAMLDDLRDDNAALTRRLRQAYELCDDHGDFAGAALLARLIDEAEQRVWLLFETTSHSG